MATANLGLESVDPSDYVSPTPFNTNFEKLDALGLDYVTASGKSGEWWYRKWKSGRMECGIDDKNFGNVAHTTGWSGMYISAQLNFGAYPFAFASRPFATITFQSNSGGEHNSYVSYASSTSTTTSPKFVLVDPNSGTANSAHFGIYVCGRYK
ncbi:hypothetical protein [uncultured Bifidobacterium sp.]|uniref:hypothetical protein n=1 Tax=uncultured Bifidobacterium sp. TaxID=165187 RepID=UPI002594783C|nr:hypothetical protein [uncultured Bifidobacterium sp.]